MSGVVSCSANSCLGSCLDMQGMLDTCCCCSTGPGEKRADLRALSLQLEGCLSGDALELRCLHQQAGLACIDMLDLRQLSVLSASFCTLHDSLHMSCGIIVMELAKICTNTIYNK